MDRPLAGRSIVIVEDEPNIALDIATAFQNAGAQVTTTTTLDHAKTLVEHDGLAAAVLDHGLGNGNSSSLCERLAERGIPFVIYSGFGTIDEGACRKAPQSPNQPTRPPSLLRLSACFTVGRFQTETLPPFVMHSGLAAIDTSSCHSAPHILKPADPAEIVAALVTLLDGRNTSN